MLYKTVKRTLRERLFSLPWNPLKRTKQVRDYEAEARVLAADFTRGIPVNQVLDSGRRLTPLRCATGAASEHTKGLL